MSMGGHVESGESYEEALARELMEELRLDVRQAECKLLGYLTPGNGVSAFMKVYCVVTDKAPAYNKADFLEAHWLSPEELLRRLRDGELTKGDLAPLVERFYTTGTMRGDSK